jgi:hypothetical protein
MTENMFTFKKHILISGKTQEARHTMLNHILSFSNHEIFRFPASMRSFHDYLKFVQSKNLFFPFYETKGKYNLNQILDFHMDWIKENNCIFVFEEFQKADKKFGTEILRIMINTLEMHKKSAVKIILSAEDETEWIDILNDMVNETGYKTKSEVVADNLQIISI